MLSTTSPRSIHEVLTHTHAHTHTHSLSHVCYFSLSPELAKTCVLPELTELTTDEEANVRETALEAIADVIPYLPPETIKVNVVPLVQRVCQEALSTGNEGLIGVARLLGKLSHQMKGNKINDMVSNVIIKYIN